MKLEHVWSVEVRHPNTDHLIKFISFDNEVEAIGYAQEYLYDIYEVNVLHNGQLYAALGYADYTIEILRENGVMILDEERFFDEH
jgi:hypothetical protein